MEHTESMHTAEEHVHVHADGTVHSHSHAHTHQNTKTVKNRLDVYHKQTQPLIDFYEAKGILKSVDGTVPMEDVFAAITEILG